MLVNWSDEANSDLNAIIDFIYLDNPLAAMDFSELIFETTEKISNMPYMGKNGRVSGTREFVVHPSYVLVYQVKLNEILILRVLHTSKKYP